MIPVYCVGCGQELLKYDEDVTGTQYIHDVCCRKCETWTQIRKWFGKEI